jgi:hypothetical protein
MSVLTAHNYIKKKKNIDDDDEVLMIETIVLLANKDIMNKEIIEKLKKENEEQKEEIKSFEDAFDKLTLGIEMTSIKNFTQLTKYIMELKEEIIVEKTQSWLKEQSISYSSYSTQDTLDYIKSICKDKETIKEVFDDLESPYFYHIESDEIHNGDYCDEDDLSDDEDEEDEDEEEELEDDIFVCDKCNEKYCTEECHTLTDGESQLGDFCNKCWRFVKKDEEE